MGARWDRSRRSERLGRVWRAVPVLLGFAIWGLPACRSIAGGGLLDVEVVTEPSGGVVRRVDWDPERAAWPAPFKVRDEADALPVGRTPDHRRVDLVAAVPGGRDGPARATRGSIHAVVLPSRTLGGAKETPALFVDRVESADGGAWWFDGLFVRARPSQPGRAYLVLRQERAGMIQVDGARVASSTVHGVDRVHECTGSGSHVVEFTDWTVDVSCPAGTVVQLVETVRGARGEFSVPRDAPSPRIDGEAVADVSDARWPLPRSAFTATSGDGAVRVRARPRRPDDAVTDRRGLDVRISGAPGTAGTPADPAPAQAGAPSSSS